MQVYSNILDMVGQTPMLEITKLDTGPCRLFLKLELMNPGGSIKDRIGISMIEEAEKRGDLRPGATIVEATAGNTGLGLALVAQQKGVSDEDLRIICKAHSAHSSLAGSWFVF
ncbi:MAG: pyridoxal-phosphate dependent enzyme, partial [Pseudomonadota bacterium]